LVAGVADSERDAGPAVAIVDSADRIAQVSVGATQLLAEMTSRANSANATGTLAALVAGSKGDVAGWIVGRGSEVFPNGASQREIEILAIGFDAASSDVVLYARCSIDPHGIPDEDFVTLGRDEVDAQLVETEAGRWQRADATLFLLHLAASPGYGWGYVRQLVQSVAPRSGESLHGT